MKRILVPTDFSDCSDSALAIASKVALKAGSEIFLLHLQPVMSAAVLSGTVDDDHIRTNRNKLFKLADQTERLGIKSHIIFVEDTGLERIQDYVKPYGIDLIVMGSHGWNAVKDFFIGSTTKKLIREVQVPVLVIRSINSSDLYFSRVLFASSFRRPLHRQLVYLREFSSSLDAEVHFLFLNLLYHLIEEKQASAIMEDYLPIVGSNYASRSVVDTNDEVSGIIGFLENFPASVLAVEMEHPGVPARWISPPLAEKLIQSVNLPILVLPSGNLGQS